MRLTRAELIVEVKLTSRLRYDLQMPPRFSYSLYRLLYPGWPSYRVVHQVIGFFKFLYRQWENDVTVTLSEGESLESRARGEIMHGRFPTTDTRQIIVTGPSFVVETKRTFFWIRIFSTSLSFGWASFSSCARVSSSWKTQLHSVLITVNLSVMLSI